MRGSVIAFCLLVLAARAEAREYSPRVVSAHNADSYSMKTFARFHRWRNLTGDAKVFAIYKYLADRRTGLYPMGQPAWEGREKLPEYAGVRDPVKMLNVYPIGHCGTLGPTMAGIMQDMGVGKSRTLIIPGWNHVAAEVFYNGQWHYLDLDVRAVFRRKDGSLASMQQAQRDPTLWKRRTGPLFFPLDPLARVQTIYAKTSVGHRHGQSTGGHTMDFVLRQGERFTRWWKPQGGRWNHHPSYVAKPFFRKLFERNPRGPKSKHASFTVHSHGNGRFLYKPNLTRQSSDFADGKYDAHNVQPGAAGLTLKKAGRGYAIFEVRSPYVIVPLVGKFDSRSDDREASVVKIDSSGAKLSVSLDNGNTWNDVDAKKGMVDLTSLTSGTYGYLLKVSLQGEPGKAVVRSLEIATWVQLHPASLPSLRKGKNAMQFVAGDHYGLPTRVVEIRPEAGQRDTFLRHLLKPPSDFDPSRHTARIRGSFIVKVPAPPGAKIAWVSAGGSFRTYQGPAAKKTRNSIAIAVDELKNFREIYRARIPIDQDHWHYNADREVRLKKPARMVYLRYVGDPAVNNIRIYAHCVDDRPRSRKPVVITHVWTEAGARKSKSVRLKGPGGYEIVTAANPVDESIEIAVRSDGAVATKTRRTSAKSPETNQSARDKPSWVASMKKVHARFKGKQGVFAVFGDSISFSRAFWFSLRYSRKNASAEMKRAFQLVNKRMLQDCWDRKGPQFGNKSGMTIRWADKNVATWLKVLNPEVVILMFGSNDLHKLKLKEYETKTRAVVQKCLENGTVVILSTIPPRHGYVDKATKFAAVVRKIAREMKVPLTDYHAAILKRRPHDWDGALEKFKAYRGYDVPTLIARDGVHPSNPKRYRNDYSNAGLKNNGFVLRNYLALMKYAEVIRRVLEDER